MDCQNEGGLSRETGRSSICLDPCAPDFADRGGNGLLFHFFGSRIQAHGLGKGGQALWTGRFAWVRDDAHVGAELYRAQRRGGIAAG